MSGLPQNIIDSVTVENIVTSTDIGKQFDLEKLNQDLSKSQFNVDQFPGLIYRTEDPKVTLLVFRSGKIVCTGSQDVNDSQDALQQLFDEFDELGVIYEPNDLAVQNVVGVADLGEALNLNAIAIGFGLEHTEYEPEQFPGIVYRMEELSTVGLVFGSGKLVITGGKSPDDIVAGVESIYNELVDLSLLMG